MSNTADLARRELERIGEEPDVIDWYCRVIDEFMSMGHSGGSASVAIPTLCKLLRQEALSPLTNDPREWINRSDISGYPLWQNRRDGRAMSGDGGRTYYLVDEPQAAGSKHTIYESESA